jgi:hypothetical protein
MKNTLIAIVNNSVSGKSKFGEYFKSNNKEIAYFNCVDFIRKSNGKSNPSEQERIVDLFNQISKREVVIIDNASLSIDMKNIYGHFQKKILILEANNINREALFCFRQTGGIKASRYQYYNRIYHTPQSRYKAERIAAINPTVVMAAWLMTNDCLTWNIQRMLK